MAQLPSEAHDGPMKLTVTHYRQPNRTHEDFIKWIVEGHLPIAVPIFKRHGIVSYSLFITPPPINAQLKQEIGAARPTWDFADYDCVIEYVMPNPDAIKAVMGDPEWPISLKEEPDYLDASKALISLGYVKPYMLPSGELVNMPVLPKE
ncbi:hypothetical protein GGR56DRAFT_639375 [Xylariaceae sp. FL0804]|nr:hypothetical protein GGR56DRAFT_639375 [Xylariaceae sp. FL0804]